MNAKDKGKEQNTSISIDLPGKKLDAAASRVLEATLGRTAVGLGETVATVWGGLIGDRINEWRTRNFVDSLEKTAKYLEEKGVNLADCLPLPNGEMYSIFEGISKQDDPDLQEMWASLLANSIDPDGLEFRKEFTVILESLEPTDARLFTFVAKVERFEEQHDQRMPVAPNDIFMTDKSSEADVNRSLWKKHQLELDTFRQLEFEKMDLSDINCRQACGRLIRNRLLEEHKSLRIHYWRNTDELDEIYEGLERTANRIKAMHTGEISGSFFNLIAPEMKAPNYKLTNLGKEIAAACIATDI